MKKRWVVRGSLDIRIPVSLVLFAETEDEAREVAQSEFELRGEMVEEDIHDEDVLQASVESVEEKGADE